MAERTNSEKKIEHNKFKLKIGTTNRNNPLVVYIEGGAYISPNSEKNSYDRDIYDIKRCLTKSINDNIKNTNLFDHNFILDFQVAQNGVSRNKKSFLTFQFLLKQNADNIHKMKEIKELSKDTITKIIDTLEESIYKHDFSLYKSKNG